MAIKDALVLVLAELVYARRLLVLDTVLSGFCRTGNSISSFLQKRRLFIHLNSVNQNGFFHQ